MEPRIYIVVNSSLKMGKGKVIAQACHGVSRVTEYMLKNHPDEWNTYLNSGERKITVKADQEKLELLRSKYSNSEYYCYAVFDLGFTQIPANSFTCMVFRPMDVKDTPDDLKALKLYG